MQTSAQMRKVVKQLARSLTTTQQQHTTFNQTVKYDGPATKTTSRDYFAQ